MIAPYSRSRIGSALQPGAFEHKYYAPGTGPVLSVSRGGSREELVSFLAEDGSR